MTENLRGAVIGCGWFAQNHLNCWRDIEGVDIVAVCDRDPAKAQHAGETFGVAGVFTDAEMMLQSADVDFVDIITTAEIHRAMVELAARYQKHAICQKPFAPSMDDARAMVEVCQKADVRLMVHENFRWQMPMLKVKEHLPNIGELFFGRISFRTAFDVYKNQPYLAQEERLIIYDLGIHLLDLARFFFGDVQSLTCLTQRVNPRVKGEDVATILLRMCSGATCLVDLSFSSSREIESFPQTYVYVEGSHGSIHLKHNYQLTVVKGNAVSQETAVPAQMPWSTPSMEAVQGSVAAIQQHWVECLRSNREPHTSGADNLKTLELVFGAYEAAETGMPYRVDTV